MATLEKIRNRAGVLVAVIIGIALLAFILGDFLNSGRTLFSSSQFEIAEISGKSIPYQKYQKEINDITEITKFTSGQSTIDEASMMQIREQTWQQMIREYVLEDEYKELGIDVSSQELWDMVQGTNIHPIIQRLFTNPETGQVNTLQIIRFLKSYDQDPTGQQKTYWLFIEDQLVQDRMFSKYTNLIKKGLFATTAEANAEMKNSGKKVDINFILSPYTTVSDSLVKISTADLKDYYDNHESEFKQTASRSIEYITFDVVPSESDRKAAENWISSISEDFAKTENDKEFISLNSDLSFDNSFYKEDELPENLRPLFEEKEGALFGPYFDDEAYKLAKVSEVKNVPDSVRARHILIQPSQQDVNYSQLYALADSLKGLLEKGASFATLAIENSSDKAANEKGGDLGWFRANEMVSPFSDTCFNSKVGKIKLVATNYGLHIVEVTAKSPEIKKVKLAVLARKLEASSETVQQTYAQASQFAGTNITYEKFTKAIDNQKLVKRVANNIQEGDQQIAGLEYPRELIRSVYQADLHEIVKSGNNPIFELGDRFVIGFVSEIKEEGIAPFEQVKAQLTVQVRREKKAEILSEQIKSKMSQSGTIYTLAQVLNTPVQEANDISFKTYSVPNTGVEPKLVAVATNMAANKLSAPIKGNIGVFVIEVKNIKENNATNSAMQKSLTTNQLQNRANYEAFEALKEASNIVDKRAKFY
ncbi:MAG: hypothetical protein A2X13_07215 [Bacteroidetes bacterium GWC2_33_15]|nr:MAG: hypothetical protein A2X10_11490 [Bacteroidetes bacterium GWA2_33_15]OFX51264.1 MAG: hypothetical protein A2X13_07215 [Bacteroidetes bacterium GWC2_33_15]OFX66374.1 MAG: hypothetical protein A2X15_00270 [Bacteroidetes bacterium GWB2_32_14]OFX70667.1 MAG: hypothetical protein A2X14_10955 [Bacteroidetes bacterium GWD2_33_33]HAN20047.1 peptidylprolyl isomerase [Bacteroidales bacterium]